MMKKLLFLFSCLVSLLSAAQTKNVITADTVILKSLKATGATFVIENATKNRVGSYLQNYSNGKTKFSYAIDSSYISNDTIYFHRGDGWFGLQISGGGIGDPTVVHKAGGVETITDRKIISGGLSFTGTQSGEFRITNNFTGFDLAEDNGNTRFSIDRNNGRIKFKGDVTPTIDDAYDLGIASTGRFRNLYMSGSGTFGGSVTIQSTGSLTWGTGVASIRAANSTTLVLTNNGLASFGFLAFGSNTAGFPAIKRVSAGLEFWTANGGALTTIGAKSAFFSNTASTSQNFITLDVTGHTQNSNIARFKTNDGDEIFKITPTGSISLMPFVFINGYSINGEMSNAANYTPHLRFRYNKAANGAPNPFGNIEYTDDQTGLVMQRLSENGLYGYKLSTLQPSVRGAGLWQLGKYITGIGTEYMVDGRLDTIRTYQNGGGTVVTGGSYTTVTGTGAPTDPFIVNAANNFLSGVTWDGTTLALIRNGLGSINTTLVHQHTTSAITSGTFPTARLASGTATSGYVPISDGAGNAVWGAQTGGGGTTYTAGNGIIISGTVIKIDSLVTTTWSRLYKVADSLSGAFNASLALKAPIANPTFTGVQTGTTAPFGTNSTRLVTAAFVHGEMDSISSVQRFTSFTTGTTWIIGSSVAKTVVLYFNPATTQASATIKFPASIPDNQTFEIHFGGIITSGSVIDSLSFDGNGKTIGRVTSPPYAVVAYDVTSFRNDNIANIIWTMP